MNFNITDINLMEINTKRKMVIRKISYINKLQIVILNFNFLQAGKYIMTITYDGIITYSGTTANDDGGFVKIPYKSTEGYDKWLIATDNSATGTRRLFPCWDEPRIKADFKIAIEHPKHYRSFSNMSPFFKLFFETRTTTYFSNILQIPTYCIAIVLLDKNDYSNITYEKIDLKLWGREPIIQNQTFAFELIENVTNIVNHTWKLQEKNIIGDHYVIAGLENDGVDKFQFVFHREKDIVYNEGIDPIAQKMEISRLIGRKVMGKLFAKISPTTWSDIWFNEGVTTLFGIYIVNKVMPDIRLLDLFVVQTQQESLRLDDQQIMSSLTPEVNNIFENDIFFPLAYYIKAPCILRMLEHALGNQIFQDSIIKYLEKQTGNPDDFWTAIQSAYDLEQNKTMIGEINVKDIMDPWIKEKQYPVLEIDYKKRWFLIENMSKKCKIPFRYIFPPYITFQNTSSLVWLNVQYKHIYRDDDIWKHMESYWPLIANPQQTGYYRVNYNEDNWIKIARYLNSENYTNIHVLNRAQIIDDAFHFVTSHKLSYFIFVELTNYLSRETDYIAWYPMFKAIERMSYIIPYLKNTTFQIQLLKLLNSLLDKIEYEKDPNENDHTKCLRQEAIRWACVLGDKKCKVVAEIKLYQYLTLNPMNVQLWEKKWMYCNGVLAFNTSVFNKVFNNLDKILETKNSEILEFLICSNPPSNFLFLFDELKKLRNDYESIIYTEDNTRMISVIKNQITAYYYVVQRHANDFPINFILSDLEAFKPKEISITATLINVINSVHSLTTLVEIKEWIYENLHNSLFWNTQDKIYKRLSEIQRHIKSYVNTYI
ncbi:hypothetical protein P5V15_008242 [Pogonomyrmex californicus]